MIESIIIFKIAIFIGVDRQGFVRDFVVRGRLTIV